MMRRVAVLAASLAVLVVAPLGVAAASADPVAVECTSDGATLTCPLPAPSTVTNTETATEAETVTGPGTTVTVTNPGSTVRTTVRTTVRSTVTRTVTTAPTTATSGTPTPTVPSTTSTTITTPTTSNPTPALLDLPRVAWWGGPAYWAQFPKAAASGWADPSFFPISVFLGKPSHAASLKAAGVNTYMGAEHDGSTMASITGQGISVIAQDEWTQSELGSNPRVVGYFLSDECDMGLGGCGGDSSTEQDRVAQQRAYAQDARAHNDGRFVQANFGNGVLGTYWSPTTMDDQVALLDLSSVDKYAYTSPGVRDVITDSPYWPSGKAPASAGAYGWLQDRMESFASPAGSKPNWVFVETAKPYLTDRGATTIAPAQISGAVWSSLIHGAAGIAYFQHNNNGTCGNYSIVECPDARAAVTAVDAEVKSLAPVLNSQPYAWTFGTGLDTSLRAYDGAAYILAMTSGGTGTRTFTLPGGITGSTVEVVGENRSIPIVGGQFSDTFAAEYTHHVYKIGL